MVIYLVHILLYVSSHQDIEDDEQSQPSASVLLQMGFALSQYVTMPAVSSYLAFSSLPVFWRLFSVALSLRFPSLDVIQHHCSVEPGLSSYAVFRPCYTRLSNLLLLFYTYLYKKSIISY